jgi:hypothetical protein
LASDLANAVTAFATILSGVIALLFTFLISRQPWRWIVVYIAIVITGIATVWYHGYGETHIAGLADGGTNLLLAWLLQVAVLWDYYPHKFRWITAVLSGVLNLIVIMWRAVSGPGFTSFYIISFGAFGGFHPMEVMLILDSVLVLVLMYANFPRIPVMSRALLYLFTGFFFIGALLSAASNQRIDFHILCYHALWHIASAFGFVTLWAFNHMRFAQR